MLAQAVKQIAHVDMDAFYVSVELLYRPELRGQPVVVGAPGDQRGVVAAASYEARAFGIHSAMPSRTAKKLCPHAVFLPGNYELYEQWSERVRTVFERFTPVVHMVSIDEAYLDLTGTERLHGTAWAAAQKIQRAVWEETQLPCSIGVAQSCVVSKVASDLAKPRGLLWIPVDAEAAFLAPLPVRRIPGIGKVTEKTLAGLGVRTVGELARVKREKLEEVFGQWGEALYRKARGQDADLWFLDEEQKSISHERTFAEDVGDAQQLDATLAYLAELVGQRLREARLYARTVTLKLRYANFQTLTRALTLNQPTDLDVVLYEAAARLFRRNWNRKRKLRLLGIAAGQLGAAPGQLSLLDADRHARREKLTAAADAVRNRFGADALRSAKSLLRKPAH
ncbi:MAG: DNA polymerase IV [Acidobacteria bacterium]|nr:DNA polymerase IV [Acidobacteriota bacterium]